MGVHTDQLTYAVDNKMGKALVEVLDVYNLAGPVGTEQIICDGDSKTVAFMQRLAELEQLGYPAARERPCLGIYVLEHFEPCAPEKVDEPVNE